MASTENNHTLDVNAFFENAGVTRFHVWLLVLSSFVTLFDGLDFSLISFTLLYSVLAVFWYRLMHRYTIEGVADSERDPSPDNPDNDPDSASDRPLSFAY